MAETDVRDLPFDESFLVSKEMEHFLAGEHLETIQKARRPLVTKIASLKAEMKSWKQTLGRQIITHDNELAQINSDARQLMDKLKIDMQEIDSGLRSQMKNVSTVDAKLLALKQRKEKHLDFTTYDEMRAAMLPEVGAGTGTGTGTDEGFTTDDDPLYPAPPGQTRVDTGRPTGTGRQGPTASGGVAGLRERRESQAKPRRRSGVALTDPGDGRSEGGAVGSVRNGDGDGDGEGGGGGCSPVRGITQTCVRDLASHGRVWCDRDRVLSGVDRACWETNSGAGAGGSRGTPRRRRRRWRWRARARPGGRARLQNWPRAGM